jgi:hypothetical protein
MKTNQLKNNTLNTLKNTLGKLRMVTKYNPGLVALIQPKPADEECMVSMVDKYLTEYIGQEAVEHFRNDPVYKSATGKTLDVQRLMINRYFTNVLLRYRSKKNNNINIVITSLINDGTFMDWITLFRSDVIPFIKEHNVYAVIA